MASPIYGIPLTKIEGETKALSTTAGFVLLKPTYHEVKMYCASQWRIGLAPHLARVKLYTGSAYVDYTSQATDRVDTTHVPLDGMTTSKYLYLGVTEPTRGFYFNVDGTNKNDEAATLDWEYMYDIAQPGSYFKLTGTVSAALTVGETITGSVSGATGVAVYDDGSTYLVVKTVSGAFALAENAAGATQACNTITAIDRVATGTGYFTDVAGDSDGTNSVADTLKQDGLYYFTLPSVVRGALAGVDNESLFWYRFKPSATLSTTVDLVDIIPAAANTDYGYMEPGMEYQFSFSTTMCGAFEILASAGTPTLDISWVKH